MQAAKGMGLAAVLASEITFEAGRVEQSSCHDSQILRIDQMQQVPSATRGPWLLTRHKHTWISLFRAVPDAARNPVSSNLDYDAMILTRVVALYNLANNREAAFVP
jgi:hypothetical protein